MRYVDLHCDTLSKSKNVFDFVQGDLQTSLQKLNTSECAAQCFAIFTDGENASARFSEMLDLYAELKSQNYIQPVLCAADLQNRLSSGGVGGILTVENCGFIKDEKEFYALERAGVRMASLVWNSKNAYAYPNLIFSNGMPEFEKREGRGLTKEGRRAVSILDELKIIIDISHLSDGGAEDILTGRKIPIVASHSNTAKVCNVSRNLTDGQIRKIAECGGVIGVNFCEFFLGEGSPRSLVLKHINRLIDVGGEDCIAFGSDFDGIPATPEIEDCTKMQPLLEYLNLNGIKAGVLEKLCYKNFLRVFKDICG